MIKGLYAAVSAMIAGAQKQQLKVHNLANSETPGFKQVMTNLQEFSQTPVSKPETGVPIPNPGAHIGDLGLGVMTTSEYTNFGQGTIRSTGNPLDLAIEGAGFFPVRTPEGDRYTRDGRFLRDAQGQLVTVDGFRVLDSDGKPILLPVGEVTVSEDGTMTLGDQTIGKITLAVFDQPQQVLERAGENTFTAKVTPSGKSSGVIQQGALEMSNVNVISLMAGASVYQAAQKVVQTQDELLGKAITTLGKLG